MKKGMEIPPAVVVIVLVILVVVAGAYLWKSTGGSGATKMSDLTPEQAAKMRRAAGVPEPGQSMVNQSTRGQGQGGTAPTGQPTGGR
jgi:hypothetical protein